MSPITKIILYFLSLSFPLLIFHSNYLSPFIPQIIALAAIIVCFFAFFRHQLSLYFFVFIINLVILDTGATTSPLFFLQYFLLFFLAFQNSPTTNLLYSLITILPYSYSLSSLSSLLQLFSLLLITPLTWFLAKQEQNNQKVERQLSQDETDFMLWISLQLKNSLEEILSLTDHPRIKTITKTLLKNSQKIISQIDRTSDET